MPELGQDGARTRPGHCQNRAGLCLGAGAAGWYGLGSGDMGQARGTQARLGQGSDPPSPGLTPWPVARRAGPMHGSHPDSGAAEKASACVGSRSEGLSIGALRIVQGGKPGMLETSKVIRDLLNYTNTEPIPH